MVNLYVPFYIFQFWEHLVDWIFNPFNGSYKFFLEFLIWNNRVPSHFLELIYQNKILFGHISTWGKFNWECWKLGKVGNILKNYSRKEIPKFIFSLRNIVVSLAAAQFRHVYTRWMSSCKIVSNFSQKLRRKMIPDLSFHWKVYYYTEHTRHSV